MTTTATSLVLEKHGGPDVFVERQIELSDPGPDQVQIRVAAAGINFADILQRLGLYGSAPELPYTPGFEVAGRVEAVGDEVANLSVGDRVVTMVRTGGYSDRVLAPAAQTLPLPESVDLESAAAIPVNYLTAWICLFDMARLQEGESVLIQSGAGGVGTAAVQMALDTGATVFATAGSDRKVEFLRELGVQHPINYRSTAFDEAVRDVSGPRNLDVLLDAVGGETLRRGYELVAPLGRVVAFGLSEAVSGENRNLLKALWAWWKTPSFSLLDLTGRNVGVYGFHLAHMQGKEDRVLAAFRAILEKFEAGTYEAVIAETFPLTGAGVADAHRFIHERRNIGKVLLVPPAETGEDRRSPRPSQGESTG